MHVRSVLQPDLGIQQRVSYPQWAKMRGERTEGKRLSVGCLLRRGQPPFLCTGVVSEGFDGSAAPRVLLRLSLEAEFLFLGETFISQDSSVDGG